MSKLSELYIYLRKYCKPLLEHAVCYAFLIIDTLIYISLLVLGWLLLPCNYLALNLMELND